MAPTNRFDFPAVGLLVVGHGTRNRAGLAEFELLARQIALQARGFAVESCFLELAEPNIEIGVRRLLQRGIERLIVAPVLLFAAGHAKRDIPTAVDSALVSYKADVADDAVAPADMPVQYLGALECCEPILKLSSQRYREALEYSEALADRPQVDPDETLLIMAARGSSVPEAIAMTHRFTQLRAERTRVGQYKTCFAAIASPTLSETLAWAADTPFRRIVVQPHLLFTGEVLEQIERGVQQIAPARPDQVWIVAPHLGPSPLLAEAIVEMARSVTCTEPRP